MNAKKSKAVRKIAKVLSQVDKSYMTKKTTKVYKDLKGDHFPYTTDQTVLHPKCTKAAVKFLKGCDKEGLDIHDPLIKELFAVESTADLSELAANGYTLT